jgi:hypothetical protein
MGPKKGKKAKGETEEEKAARLEAERLAAEAEAKRLAEEAEKKRLEEERIAAENKAARLAEMEVLTKEFEEWMVIKKEREKNYLKESQILQEKLDWEKYVEPTSDYEVTSERDINTFLSLNLNQKGLGKDGTILLTSQISTLVNALDAVWAGAVASGNDTQRNSCLTYKNMFEKLLKSQIDEYSGKLLRTADQELNDRGEYQKEFKSEGGVCMGIWACLTDIRPIRKAIHFEELEISIDVPKQILQQDSKFVHRCIKLPFDTHNFQAYTETSEESQKYVIVGDIIIIDILLPPPSSYDLSAKKWILKDRSEKAQELKYSTSYPSTVPSKCTIKISEKVHMTDDLTMAYFDSSSGKWIDSVLQEYSYNSETRQVQFNTTSLGAFALVKKRQNSFPYKSWSLSPQNISTNMKENYEKYCQLKINVEGLPIAINVIGDMCCLVEPINLPAVRDLLNKKLSPGALLLKLQKRGINILPTKLNPTHLDRPCKDIDLEEEVMTTMALCASSLDFSSTPWMHLEQCGPSRIGIYVRESVVYIGSEDLYDYECVLIEKDSVSDSYIKAPDSTLLPGCGAKYLLVMGDQYKTITDGTYSHKPRPNERYRVNLIESLDTRLTAECKERILRTNGGFEHTVLTLLRLVRPLVLG